MLDQTPGLLLQSSTLSGGLFWAIALYLPLSAPLSRFEASLESSPLSAPWRQAALVISSLLLALAFGVVTQLGLSWVLGPGWASSLGIVAVSWSALLVLASGGED